MTPLVPPWLTGQQEEVDEFGNPIPAPYQMPDPAQMPPGMAQAASAANDAALTPPGFTMPQDQPQEPPPPNFVPPWLTGQQEPQVQRPDPAQAPPGLQAPIGAANKQIDRGGMPATSGVARVPSLQEQEAKNVTDMGSLRAEKAGNKAIMMAGAIAQQNRLAAQDAQADLKAQQDLNARLEERNKMADDYANGTIDPDRWAERTSFLGAIAYGIAAFFSGMANPRGPNQVVQFIEREIDRDLEAQRADLMRKGNALTMKGNIYNDYMQKYKDEDLARAAMRDDKLALAQAQIATMEASYAPAEEKLKAQQTIIELEKLRRANYAEFEMKLAEMSAKERKEYMEWQQKNYELQLRDQDSRRDAHVQMRGQDVAARTADKNRISQENIEGGKVERQLNAEDRDRAVFGPDPGGSGKNVVVGYIASKEDRHDMRKFAGAHREFLLNMRRYKQLREKYGRTGGLSVAETAEAKQAYKTAIALWNGKMRLGAYDKGVETLAQDALPKPQDWKTIGDYFGNTDTAVDQAIGLAIKGGDEVMDAYGFQGADPTKRYSDYFPEGTDAEGGYVDVVKPRKQVSPEVGKPLGAPKIGP